MSPSAPGFWTALLAIVVIDLVLAGDNALVIGIAARNVPKTQQRAVILWGTFGAIVVRALLTGAVVWLLKIPGFMVTGGLALVWIAWTLGAPRARHGEAIAAAGTLGAAVRTIVIADTVMGIDNVLAVGGAAQGSFVLVLLGLAISIPIVVWGSTLVLKWVDRVPAILWLGVALLGWTAAKMIASEPLLAPALDAWPHARTVLYVLIVGGLVFPPLWRSIDRERRAQFAAVLIVAVWLTALGWVEDRYGAAFNPFDRWRWDDELIDLVRWVGWIPLVMWLDRRLTLRRAHA
jgi:YjbE family integral membrane protein